MLKIFFAVMRRFAAAFEPRPFPCEADPAGAWRDPLSHPALARMDPRQLADLPLSNKVPSRMDPKRS